MQWQAGLASWTTHNRSECCWRSTPQWGDHKCPSGCGQKRLITFESLVKEWIKTVRVLCRVWGLLFGPLPVLFEGLYVGRVVEPPASKPSVRHVRGFWKTHMEDSQGLLEDPLISFEDIPTRQQRSCKKQEGKGKQRNEKQWEEDEEALPLQPQRSTREELLPRRFQEVIYWNAQAWIGEYPKSLINC